MNDEIEWTSLLRVLREMAEAIKQQAINYLAEDGSNASRTLTNSIDYEYGIDDNHYWIDIYLEDYWKYVNDGRNAGKMPPVEKIKQWILIKPIQPELPSVRSLAYWIRGSIKKRKGFAPPVKALEDWINKKGLQRSLARNYPSVESLAWAIAKNIGKKGTKGTHFLDRAVEIVQKAYADKIADAIQSDLEYWLENVVNEFLKSLSI